MVYWWKKMEYNFVITSPIQVEESFSDKLVLSGIALKLDSVTKNGRIYRVEEGEEIANGLVGMPIFYGTTAVTNEHDKKDPVGKVIKTALDVATNTIRAWFEVWNNSRFPDLISRIKQGWGLSIGGVAVDMKETGLVTELGKAVKKVLGMKPNHLQLLEPFTPRGQAAAQVETVTPIEESLAFDPCPWGVCEIKIPVTTTEEAIHKMSSPITIIRTTKKVIYILDPDSAIV